VANDCPVVLVHGLFGWGPGELAEFPYWGKGLTVPSPLPRLVASVGPISSLHDRACELAFNIRGDQAVAAAARR
jgi:triacylglycerol esterase/lipase EstA (alpha/beta hydrolase family)